MGNIKNVPNTDKLFNLNTEIIFKDDNRNRRSLVRRSRHPLQHLRLLLLPRRTETGPSELERFVASLGLGSSRRKSFPAAQQQTGEGSSQRSTLNLEILT